MWYRLIVVGVVILSLAILVSGLWLVLSSPPVLQQEVTTQTFVEETDSYRINVKYPHVGVATIDTRIVGDIEALIKEFKSYPSIPEESAAEKNVLTIFYDALFRDSKHVSFQLIISQDTGGAHPLTLFSGQVFSIETGQRLTADDVLSLVEKTIDEISKEATLKFSEKFGEGFFVEGADTNPENFSSFILDEDSVTFIFQQYQVAAYAYGPQEIIFTRK